MFLCFPVETQGKRKIAKNCEKAPYGAGAINRAPTKNRDAIYNASQGGDLK
jgi:hypothetical protein